MTYYKGTRNIYKGPDALINSLVENAKPETVKKIANNTLQYETVDGYIGIQLHDAEIVRLYPDNTVKLFTHGWKTNTTKQRMNEFINPFWVHQENGVWYVRNYRTHETFRFKDGITLNLDSETVTGYDETDPVKDKQIRKQIRKYAKNFMRAFFAGEVKKPDAGDCFFCRMQTESGEPLGDSLDDTNHLKSHFEEPYYVPSLLYNAIQAFRVSPIANDTIARVWFGEQSEKTELFEKISGYETIVDITTEQCEKSITRYLYKQLGYGS